MTDILFARTRHVYDSYQDFWRLVELSGFPTCYVDEIDPDRDCTYIYTPSNGETRNGWRQGKARIIQWALEWCIHPNDRPEPDPGVAEVWAMDVWLAERIGARYVPIGSHADLCLNNMRVTDYYDVAWMAYMTPRRAQIAQQLGHYQIKQAGNDWGKERDKTLNQSTLMLHIHQHDHVPGVPALRFALAAAYRLPVITETCADYGIFGYSHLLRADYGHIADFTRMWLKTEQRQQLQDYGAALHGLLCEEKTFRKVIEGAL